MGEKMTLDTSRILALAAEIRRVDGGNKSGASELAERIMPFIDAHLATPAQTVDVQAIKEVAIWLRTRNSETVSYRVGMDQASKLTRAIGDKP